ncbi:MAG: type IV secretion protein Rhs [Alphaproteobacteria bacterium]|nr:type IV secretion protein Rhs [Alphaproteobacteria bacterium]
MQKNNRRPLTKNEIALARSVFGNAIQYDAITITQNPWMPFQPKGTAMTPDGHLYMHGCYRDDYATSSPGMQGLFIHEMAHVWQKQNNILNPIAEGVKLGMKYGFNYNAAYPYMLDEKKDLLDYNMEQQASIIEEHFMQKNGHIRWNDRCQNGCNATEKLRLYEGVLEKFLNNPAYARQAKPSKPQGPKIS